MRPTTTISFCTDRAPRLGAELWGWWGGGVKGLVAPEAGTLLINVQSVCRPFDGTLDKGREGSGSDVQVYTPALLLARQRLGGA